MSNSISYAPYMESGYYPHVTRDWRSRLRVAWRILWHGEFFPQPPGWYERLFVLTQSPLSHCVKRAVEKVNLEYGRDHGDPEIRFREARQWAQVYATEASLYQAGMREGTWRFLIEFWVAYHGGKF